MCMISVSGEIYEIPSSIRTRLSISTYTAESSIVVPSGLTYV
jgi:hypothetical protein